MLLGPTASGKTHLLHSLYRFPDVIINADTRQMYQHANIGTAKPTLREIKSYAYHLTDFLDLSKSFSAFDFLKQTLALSTHYHKAVRRVFIIGGPSLYTQSLLGGLPLLSTSFAIELKTILKKEYQEKGLRPFLQELKEKDYSYYAQVDQNNPVRILRAIEVIRLTGKSFTSLRTKRQKPSLNCLVLVLAPLRKPLYHMIEKRIDQMFENGFVEEVKVLVKNKAYQNKLFTMIGYKQVALFLEKKISLQDCIQEIKKKTRHFAKKQFTWLKAMEKGIFLTEIKEAFFKNKEDEWLKQMPKMSLEKKTQNYFDLKVRLEDYDLKKINHLLEFFYET